MWAGGLVGWHVAGRRFHFFDLFDQVRLLVVELVVLGAIVVEARQELHQFVPVAQQDFLHRARLVGVRDKHLNNTHTHTHTRLTALVRDYPGEPVPER